MSDELCLSIVDYISKNIYVVTVYDVCNHYNLTITELENGLVRCIMMHYDTLVISIKKQNDSLKLGQHASIASINGLRLRVINSYTVWHSKTAANISSDYQRFIDVAKEYIVDCFKDVTHHTLAIKFDVTDDFVEEAFMKILGVSFLEYILEYKIERACKLLECTSMSLNVIAEKCGFNTPSILIIRFREFRKMTPVQYRLMKRTGKPILNGTNHLRKNNAEDSVEIDKKIASIRIIIQGNPDRVDIEKIASVFKISRNILRERFNEIYGVTFANYVNDLRIKAIREELKPGQYSINEIMQNHNFRNKNAFLKLFKSMSGCSFFEYCSSNNIQLTEEQVADFVSKDGTEILLDNILEFIENNFDIVNKTLVSNCFKYSISDLDALFEKHFEMSLGEFIAARKSRKLYLVAKRILLTSDSFSEIAKDFGYFSIASFNCAFKSVTGYLPSLYREAFSKYYVEDVQAMIKEKELVKC